MQGDVSEGALTPVELPEEESSNGRALSGAEAGASGSAFWGEDMRVRHQAALCSLMSHNFAAMVIVEVGCEASSNNLTGVGHVAQQAEGCCTLQLRRFSGPHQRSFLLCSSPGACLPCRSCPYAFECTLLEPLFWQPLFPNLMTRHNVVPSAQ